MPPPDETGEDCSLAALFEATLRGDPAAAHARLDGCDEAAMRHLRAALRAFASGARGPSEVMRCRAAILTHAPVVDQDELSRLLKGAAP